MAEWEGAESDDLLIGDVTLPVSVDVDQYLDHARAEIDANIGLVYKLPLPALPAHLVGYFKAMHAQLASGRLLMAQATAMQSQDVHAYANYLIKQALASLAKIGNTFEIPDAVPQSEVGDRAPAIINPEPVSPFDRFEQYVHSPTGLSGGLW